MSPVPPTQSQRAVLRTALRPILFVLFLFPILAMPANSATLKTDTVKAWREYVNAANAQMQEHLLPGHPFLLTNTDENQASATKLRTGEILVSPAGEHIPKHVPSGLIHDWNGQAFIPNLTIHDLLPVVRDYNCYKAIYKPAVIDSKTIAAESSPVSPESAPANATASALTAALTYDDQFHMLLMNKTLIAKTALDIDFRSSYVHVPDVAGSGQRWYSISESTRIQEIAGYGTENQHKLPEDEGTGLIWRTYSITRYEERDGGVYVELQAIVLSRDIPFILRYVVSPIVRRVSREALTTSLHQTQEAVISSKLPSNLPAPALPGDHPTASSGCAIATPPAAPTGKQPAK
jgi:hypothetical protein